MSLSSALAAENNGFSFAASQNTLDMQDWYIADYHMRNPMFDTDFSAKNLSQDQALTLKVTPNDGKTFKQTANKFLGASVRRKRTSHFGLYEARFQAAKGAGVVTGFFSYTGSPYGTKHHEIDIEIMGNNTRMLNIAWFVDGKMVDRRIPLGFDAAEGVHHYAYAWHQDRLAWYVDGQLVFEHSADISPVPSLESRVFANVWVADPKLAGWAGIAAAETRTAARFELIKYTPVSEYPSYLAATGGS